MLTVIGMPAGVDDVRLAQDAYCGRKVSDHEFDRALRICAGTAIDVYLGDVERILRISNGSIIDFIWHDLNAHPHRVPLIIERSAFAEQVEMVVRLAYTVNVRKEHVYPAIHAQVAATARTVVLALKRTLTMRPPLTILPGPKRQPQVMRFSMFPPEDRLSLLINIALEHDIAVPDEFIVRTIRSFAPYWDWQYEMFRGSVVAMLVNVHAYPRALDAIFKDARVHDGLRRIFDGDIMNAEYYSQFFWVCRGIPGVFSAEREELAVDAFRGSVRELLKMLEEEELRESVTSELSQMVKTAEELGVDLQLGMSGVERLIDSLRDKR
jgi:hypothetical protein